MQLSAAVAVTLLLALTGSSFAAENKRPATTEQPANSNNIEALTATQLGDYTLQLNTDRPQPSSAPTPPGLVPSKQDGIDPFVGLKLSRPLPNDFLSFGK